jgi:hypothetical protein
MNQVALVGNITDDPELRYTQSGATSRASPSRSATAPSTTGSGRTSPTGSSAARHGAASPRTRAAPSRRACGSSSPASSPSARGRTTPATSASVEIQDSHVGPDLQFATAEVAKSTAEGLKSASDGPSAASSAEPLHVLLSEGRRHSRRPSRGLQTLPAAIAFAPSAVAEQREGTPRADVHCAEARSGLDAQDLLGHTGSGRER